MKIATHIAATLLGLIFIAFSILVLFKLVSPPPPPPGSPVAMFMGAFVPSGWLTMVKLFELLGGILVVIPTTRNFGLLVLGPIIINILAFHVLVAHGAGLVGIPLLIAVLALFLLFCDREKFLGLLR
jgi:putative oxidoreductase